jgi:hypothetical protein
VTLPLIGGIPDIECLQLAVSALPGYTEAIGLAAEADAWLAKQPDVPTVDPALAAHVTDEWVDAERAREVSLTEYQSRRLLVQRRRQQESSRAQSILAGGLDLILGALQGNLTHVLERVAAIVPELDGATTAAQAVEADAGAQWKQIDELASEYESLRRAQTFVMMRGPSQLWKSCTPAMLGEDHANLAFIRNIGDIWPDWRQPGMRTHRINLSDRSTPHRAEPWPTNEYGPEFLVWLHTSDADAWIPTTRQLRELWTAPTNISDDNDDQADTDADGPYKSMLAGPSYQPPQSSHHGTPAAVDLASRATQFKQLQESSST